MLVFKVCGVRQNLYVFSVYRNPDLDDRICDFLLALIAAVQTEDIRASFLLVGDLNGHCGGSVRYYPIPGGTLMGDHQLGQP